MATKQSSSNRRNIKRRQWGVHLKAWEKSGLSQAEYCRQNNLKSNSFSYWKNKSNNEPRDSIQFVPVPISPPPLEPAKKNIQPVNLKLEIAGRFHVEVGDAFSPTTLTRLIHVLEGV